MPSENLAQIPPFDFLTPNEQSWLVGRAEAIERKDGESFCNVEDKVYDTLFILFEGRIGVFRREDKLPQTPQPSQVRSAPTYFGELSIFFDQPRNATVIAFGTARGLQIAGTDIRYLVETNPAFSRAFATVLLEKQRIFHGYEIFLNLLLVEAEKGLLPLRSLVEPYLNLDSILHPNAQKPIIDFSALAYVMPRLPQAITRIASLYLSEDLPEMILPVQDLIQLPTQRAKKRRFYEPTPGKCLVLLRDRLTDIVDLVTKLCIYCVETKKIRERIEQAGLATDLARFSVQIGTQADTRVAEGKLPFSTQEIVQLEQLFGTELPKRLYEILVQSGDIALNFQPESYRYEITTWERWRNNIRDQVDALQKGMPDAGLSEIHIISSNTHSVMNCLSGWLHERKELILKWATEHSPPEINGLANPVDRLYAAARQWQTTFPESAAERQAFDREYGIHTQQDVSLAGIGVTLIDGSCLRNPVDPSLILPVQGSRSIIVNIDYAYGRQAELIMRNLMLLFGSQVRSISVFGKSGALVGQRGDLLLPDALMMQTTNEIYLLPDNQITPEMLKQAGFPGDIHSGKSLTVLGTAMQNRAMLHYYKLFWGVVGMEMEGAYYLREILRARATGLLSPNVALRFAYYTSDVPLETDASLATSLKIGEGIPAVYGITRVVLRSIFGGDSSK